MRHVRAIVEEAAVVVVRTERLGRGAFCEDHVMRFEFHAIVVELAGFKSGCRE